MSIEGFDHVAFPADQPEKLIEFYGRLGFLVPDVDEWRKSEKPFFSIFFGDQRINFHTPSLWQNPEFDLRGPSSAPGCGDLCFVWKGDIASVKSMLEAAGAPIIAGPVERQGARGKGTSIYIRDPEENLLEFIIYDE